MDGQIGFFLIGCAAGLVVGFAASLVAFMSRRARMERELASIESERGRLADELDRRNKDDERRRADFTAISEEILGRRTEALEASNLKSVGALIGPVKEEFEKFRKIIGDSIASGNENGAALRQMVEHEVRRMEEIAVKVGTDARGLKAALTGNVNARGQWGEALLEGLLTDSGLVKDVHYSTQVVLSDDDGKGRPDAIVRLPDGVNVVIDSKALFPNYMQYFEADTPEARRRALSEHLQSVRDTITSLSKRHYEAKVAGSIDFVVMFFPLEGSYQLVLSSEPRILTEALQRHVLPVGPATLIVMLTIIGRMWRRDEQDRNAKAILAAAQELADRVVAFGSDLDAVGRALDDASVAYESAVKRLKSPDGRSRSVASAAATLASLGVGPNRGKTPECLS